MQAFSVLDQFFSLFSAPKKTSIKTPSFIYYLLLFIIIYFPPTNIALITSGPWRWACAGFIGVRRINRSSLDTTVVDKFFLAEKRHIVLILCVFVKYSQSLQGLTGTPLVAGSPIRHEGNVQGNPVEVQTYQPPWKALSEFALQSDLDQPAFQQLVCVFRTDWMWHDLYRLLVHCMCTKTIASKFCSMRSNTDMQHMHALTCKVIILGHVCVVCFAKVKLDFHTFTLAKNKN